MIPSLLECLLAWLWRDTLIHRCVWNPSLLWRDTLIHWMEAVGIFPTLLLAHHAGTIVHIAKSLDESGNSQLSKLLQIIKIIVSILKQLAFVIGDDGNLIWQSFVCV